MSPVPEDNDHKKNPDNDALSLNPEDGANIEMTSSDDDSDEEIANLSHAGYAPLSQEPGSALDDDSDDDDDIDVVSTPSSSASPSHLDHAIRHIIDSDGNNAIGAVASSLFQGAELGGASEEKAMTTLWNEPVPSKPLDAADVDEVKKAMANFVLPPCNHPDWAKNIPEEEWKAKLVSNIRQKKDM